MAKDTDDDVSMDLSIPFRSLALGRHVARRIGFGSWED